MHFTTVSCFILCVSLVSCGKIVDSVSTTLESSDAATSFVASCKGSFVHSKSSSRWMEDFETATPVSFTFVKNETGYSLRSENFALSCFPKESKDSTKTYSCSNGLKSMSYSGTLTLSIEEKAIISGQGRFSFTGAWGGLSSPPSYTIEGCTSTAK